MRAAVLGLAMLLWWASAAFGHEVRPAYLEVRQTGAETYDVLWKVPARGEQRLGLVVELPAGCLTVGEPRTAFIGDAFTERWSVTRPGGLAGTTICIGGIRSTTTDVLVRVQHASGAAQVLRLSPESPEFVVESEPRAARVALTYLVLGLEHILLGVDHLLFVLALLILVKGGRRLVGTLTAFTVAHSITLGAATLGWVRVPGPPVEALIALSIAFVASEIVRRRQGASGMTERRPWGVAFMLGLLHGLGFASALSEVGLPLHAIPLALLFFNVGVEVGQLAFVGSLLVALAARARLGPKRRRGTEPGTLFQPWESVAAYCIGGVACFWLVERTVGFAG